MGPLDGVTQSWGDLGQGQICPLASPPRPLGLHMGRAGPTGWELGEPEELVGRRVRAGRPLCRRSRLRASRIPQLPDTGQPAHARTQRSFQEELDMGGPGRPEAGEEGPACLCLLDSVRRAGSVLSSPVKATVHSPPICGNTSVCGFEQEQRLGVSGLCLCGRTVVCLPCLLSIFCNKLRVFGVGESSPPQSCAVWPPHIPEPTVSPPGGCPPPTIPQFSAVKDCASCSC